MPQKINVIITDRTDRNICRFFIASSKEFSKKSKWSSDFLNIFCGKNITIPIKDKMMALISTSNHKNILFPNPSAPSDE